jgi:hypothetical protein
LPAPPSAAVFSHSITLDFLGLSYVPGSADDDYDIAPAKVAQSNEGSLHSEVSANPPQSNRLLGVTDTLRSRD